MLRFLLIAAVCITVAFLASAFGVIDVPNPGAFLVGTLAMAGAVVPITGTTLPTVDADGNPITYNKDGVTPRKKKVKRTAAERLALFNADNAKKVANLRWSLTKETLANHPTLGKAVAGVQRAKQWVREAEKFSDPANLADMISRLMARIDRVRARHEAAKVYAAATHDAGGDVDVVFESIGEEIQKSMNSGTFDPKNVEAFIKKIPVETIARLSAAADGAGDPFEAFRRADADDAAAEAPAADDASGTEVSEDSDDADDEGNGD